MQFFSDDYLMHYGVKGMKWKKHKVPEVKTPEEYLNEAYSEVYDMGGTNMKDWTKKRRDWENTVSTIPGDSPQRRIRDIRERADTKRKYDLRAARETAYHNNQLRIEKQQRKAKVKNTLNKLKKRAGRKVGLYRIKPSHEVAIPAHKGKIPQKAMRAMRGGRR